VRAFEDQELNEALIGIFELRNAASGRAD
jgi:hypothetical protein